MISLEVKLIKNSTVVADFNLILLMRAWNHSQLPQFVINPWRDSMMGVELICATPKKICAQSTVPILNNIKNTQIEQTKIIYCLSWYVDTCSSISRYNYLHQQKSGDQNSGWEDQNILYSLSLCV